MPSLTALGNSLVIKGNALGVGEGCCCGDSPCSCANGTLPATVTVTLDIPMEKQSGSLLPLRFSSCFGSGAAGSASAPGGVPGENNGPIDGATLTNGGSGYAVLGRSSPTITVTTKAGQPGQATVTLAQKSDDCGLPYWSAVSLSVTSAGAGYNDGDALTYKLGSGDVQVEALIATITTTRTQPVIKATATGGGLGAEFTVTVLSNADDPETWSIDTVTFTGDTFGYTDGDLLSWQFDENVVTEQLAAEHRIVCNRLEPNVSGSIFELYGTGGSGAVFSYTYSQAGEGPEIYWSIDSVTIEEPGSGYESQGILFANTAINGTVLGSAPVFIDSVDENGAIQSVNLLDGGGYFSHDGTIVAIVKDEGGAYYTQGLGGISVTKAGKFYHQSTSLPAIAAKVDVAVDQFWPSAGSGAVLKATVDTFPSSPTFGSISNVTVADGGGGYLGWTWIPNKSNCSCDCKWGDLTSYEHTVVAYRTVDPSESGPLRYTCTYRAPRCWPAAASINSTLSGMLIRARLDNGTRTEWVPLPGQVGKPGRDNQPLFALPIDKGASELRGWASYDDNGNVVAPPITVTIEQALPSTGRDAAMVANINTIPLSPNFGDVTLAYTAYGQGYLGEDFGTRPVTVEYRGPNEPPIVVSDPGAIGGPFIPCVETLVSGTLISDCGNFAFTANSSRGTAEVSPGDGTLDTTYEGPTACCGGPCYNRCPDRADLAEVTVTFTRPAATGFMLRKDDPQPYIDPLVLERDAFEMTCPEDEQEIVFDFEDLERKEECKVLKICVYDTNYFGPDWSVTLAGEDPFDLPCEAQVGIVAPPPATVPLTEPDLGLTLYVPRFNGLRWGPESTAARVHINIMQVRCAEEPSIYVVTRTSWTPHPVWFGGGGLGGGGWGGDFSKETTYTNEGAGRACANFKGWPNVTTQAEGTPAPGDVRPVQLGLDGYPYPLLADGRRICPSYEIEVEFS
jgi:hypothetical protein